MRKKYFSETLNRVVSTKEILDYNKSNNFFKNKSILKVKEIYSEDKVVKNTTEKFILPIVMDVVQETVDKIIFNRKINKFTFKTN
jgi:predicted patatin/cPLA2 family phospholipase